MTGFSHWCIECKRQADTKRSKVTRKPPSPCRVVVVENWRGERRALKYHEYKGNQPAPPKGWTVVGEGSQHLPMDKTECTLT
jgi:hypothetical protein